MLKKDYILKYVEQLTKVIAEILQLKKDGKSALAIEKIDETLQGLKWNGLNDLNNISFDYLESVADLLMIKGEINNDDKLLQEALEILQHINKQSSTYSFERNNKIQAIIRTRNIDISK